MKITRLTFGETTLKDSFSLQDEGPSGPRLGLELEDDQIEQWRFDGHGETPQLKHSDGALAVRCEFR